MYIFQGQFCKTGKNDWETTSQLSKYVWLKFTFKVKVKSILSGRLNSLTVNLISIAFHKIYANIYCDDRNMSCKC